MELIYPDLTKEILDSAYKVHTFLGPGLLESSYEACLYYELIKRKMIVQKQKALPLIYEEVKLDVAYRLDLVINNIVVIEVKAVDSLSPIHTAQLLTYLKLSGCKVGFLMNFNVKSLKEGIKRYVL